MRLNQVTLPVSDIDRARAFWRALGFTLIVEAPHYCRFEAPAGGATLSIAMEPGAAGAGPKIYFEFDSAADLDAAVARFAEAGIAFDAAPADQHWLWREARLRDPDGNRLVFYFAGKNRLHPPWRIGDGEA